MPKRTPGVFIALSSCALSFCLGCGTKQPLLCSCPASYTDYIYAVGSHGEITTFPVHQIGAELGTPTTTPGPAASAGIAQVNNAFLYASDPQAQSGASINAWTINTQSGTLTTGSPFVLGPSAQPNGLAVAGNQPGSPGPFLYVADAGKIDALEVNTATGALTAVPASPFSSGTNLYLTVDPMNRFVFAADEDSPGGVLAFTIDASTGALTDVPGSPFLIGSNSNPVSPGQIVVDPMGSFVYVTLPATGQVAGFSINAPSGMLTPIPGSPFAAGSGASAMEVTTLEFLYVANTMADSISGYSINETTGALTPLASSPFSVPGVTALAIDDYGDVYASGENGMESFSVGPGGELATFGSPVASSAATALTLVQP
jgi:6-phosphogluconolactonase